MQYLSSWFRARGTRFVGHRLISLLQRHGITGRTTSNRLDALVAALAGDGCFPTLLIPGRIVERNPELLRRLQSAGAEIAVHGYRHLDLKTLPLAEATRELEKAVEISHHCGIDVRGFRCPYLGYSSELLAGLPKGMFAYSSNDAIAWDGFCSDDGAAKATSFTSTLRSLYNAKPSDGEVSVPWTRGDLTEIPVSLPDDLWLHDGCSVATQEIGRTWNLMLGEIHRRGELFTLLFHAELLESFRKVIFELLRQVGWLRPRVWIASLRSISEWWKEKSQFKTEIIDDPDRLRVAFSCSERATILGRNLDVPGSNGAWDQSYSRLQGKVFDLPPEPRPFVGLPPDSPRALCAFLEEQGYVLDTSSSAPRCGTYLDAPTLAGLSSRAPLINHIEASAAPLIRYWRWPDGCKSALSITGDIDALSLLDYAARLSFLGGVL